MAYVNVNHYSEVLHTETRFLVTLPDNLTCDEIPVLYLLHGGGGNCRDWIKNTSVERYAEKAGIALVLPSAGPSRWNNMFLGGNYSDYLIFELPQVIRRLFPGISEKREHQYIAGLSMGGGGALTNAMMYPEKFAAVCVLSASSVIPLEHLRTTKEVPPPPGGDGMPSVAYIQTGYDDTGLLKNSLLDVLRMSSENVQSGKQLPRIFHACGTDDHAFEVSLALRSHFLSFEGNPYAYEFHTEYGRHEWGFWDKWIQCFINTLDRSKNVVSSN